MLRCPMYYLDIQGLQVSTCKQVPKLAANGGLKQDPLSGEVITEEQCGFLQIERRRGNDSRRI